ncbi:MAG: tail-specific protease [Desulfobacteraceae bacterium]|nr:MAG: tail-specific protease [Desulfobacteraceae bacterium]
MNRFSKNHLSLIKCIIAAAVAAGILALASPVAQTSDTAIHFTKAQSRIAKEIAKTLERYHYSRKDLDDEMSSKVLDIYIKQLDPSKQLFTQNDIRQFKVNEDKIDDFLFKGKLEFAESIFNLHLERSQERFSYILDQLDQWEKTYDFSMDEMLNIDNENKPRVSTTSELAPLWRKYLKNHILSLKLEDKPDTEITSELKKTFTTRLSRLSQTDIQDAFEIFINSVTAGFDPHTQYMAPRASEDFDIHMSLSLEGIGAVLQNEYEYTKVVRLIPAGPAEKSNQLMPGDKIVGVGQGLNGEIKDILGQRIENVVRLIRGPKNTYVRLKIIPAKDATSLKTIKIKRDKVKLEEQSAQKELTTIERDNSSYKIGIITIPTFYLDFDAYNQGKVDYKSTTRDVELLLSQMREQSVDGLIIDLRDNGGGALQEANQLTGLFLKSGPTVQIKTKYKTHKLYDEDPDILYKGPLMVLINRMSASASEIFAGAIKDYHRGIILGTQSFGKGTVQSLQGLKGGKLKITSAKFYRVSGESTQAMGVKPDISLPQLYLKSEVGEDSLEGTLPWDTIQQSTYSAYPSLDPVISILRDSYNKNEEKSPGVIYLKEKIKLESSLSDVKSLSLNETVRRDEKDDLNRQRLLVENNYRKLTGKPLLVELSEAENETAGEEDDPQDILLDEAKGLMAQFIQYSKDHDLTW